MKNTATIDKIQTLIDERKFETAKRIIFKRLSEEIDVDNFDGAYLKATLAGLLIDLGDDSEDKNAIEEGLSIFKKNRKQLCKFMTESSIEYNIGNAKSALFKIQRLDANFVFKPDTIKILTTAKNNYWRAYKLLPEKEFEFRPRLLTNLAISLSQSGRIAESIQYYDHILKKHPDFPEANASRAEDLIWLNNLSSSYSINLIHQALVGFKTACQSTESPNWLKEIWEKKQIILKNKLAEFGYDDKEIHQGINETQKEADSHSIFRKFCIENYLCLSEHSLYCKCSAAGKDDLVIPLSSNGIAGDFVPKMELLLNRLKSEFSLARLLFYQSQTYSDEYFESFDNEFEYTELFDDENIGIRYEILRTSFRLCFGILDKIARGVCDLFDLAKPKENIYFQSFWKKNEKRWEKINSIQNFPLLALYSQATDLNSKDGEWKVFKDWRNILEHGLLFIINDHNNYADPYNLFKNNKNFKRIPFNEFNTKTLHLLQLTRSAIFNFVFCVREEGIKLNNDSGKNFPIILKPKKLYTV